MTDTAPERLEQWPKELAYKDKPFYWYDENPEDEHSTVYLVDPNGAMFRFNHDANPSVDPARAKFFADTLNATRATHADRAESDKLVRGLVACLKDYRQNCLDQDSMETLEQIEQALSLVPERLK